MQANANSVCNGLFGAIHAIESTNNDTLIIRPRDMSEAYYLLHWLNQIVLLIDCIQVTEEGLKIDKFDLIHTV